MGVFYPHPPFSLFISTISDVKKSVIHILIHIIPITPFPHLNYFHIYGYSSADFEQSGAGLLSYGQACRARMRVRQDIVLTIPATEQEQAGYFPHLPQAGAGQDTSRACLRGCCHTAAGRAGSRRSHPLLSPFLGFPSPDLFSFIPAPVLL